MFYQLIDTGNGCRLEKFGKYSVVRPDPNVLWQPGNSDNPLWQKPDCFFVSQKDGWKFKNVKRAEGWEIEWGAAKFKVKPTPFRHIGIFPEQGENWSWMVNLLQTRKDKKVRVLNLFGYTGAASTILAMAGADVCHVDASKGSVMWAKENARLNNVEDKIRWIVDDALKFMKREVRRGIKYDLIIMDPPVFGRGPKGEIWRLEEQLIELAEVTNQLLSENPLAVLVNFYATALYPHSVERAFLAKLSAKTPRSTGPHPLMLIESETGKGFCSGFSLRLTPATKYVIKM